MKDDIQATQENPHAFGRGEDPRGTLAGGRIRTPRKYEREEFLPESMRDMNIGDRSHLGQDFWQSAPLEYVKSGNRSPTARGRHVPVESPSLLLVNPEVNRMGAYEEDYKSMGSSIRHSDSRASSRPSQFRGEPKVTNMNSSRVTYDLSPGQAQVGHEYTPRQAWPPESEISERHWQHQGQQQALSKPGWDPSIPRTPPTDLPVTPIERHRTMNQMLTEKGKASSPLKARQRMMQSVNSDVQERMSTLMDSVGYGTDGAHLSHQILQDGNMVLDDDMSQLVGEKQWLNEASQIELEPQPWELTKPGQPVYNTRNPILPGIDEQVIGPSSGSLILPPMSQQQQSMYTGSQGASLESCLGRWNELGNMVDSMTAASRQLAKLDRKRDVMQSQHPVGSRHNPSEKALGLRANRRNSRLGDPNWEAWGGTQ